jgi:putative heme-binding domain-containing protein
MNRVFTIVLFFPLLFWNCKPSFEPDPNILVKDGFIVEKLYSPSDEEQGSWVSITKDDKGRLITSDQYGALYYVEVPKIGSKEPIKVDSIPLKIGSAHGLLWAYESLYVMSHSDNPEESGLYRITDSDGDGELDHVAYLQQFIGNGEHGPHGIILGPDGYLYMAGGNHTLLPSEFESVQKPIWEEDQLFDALLDPRGHANSVTAPGGWIVRTDKEGKDLTVIAMGFRNEYDIAFNTDGELFTFDSDMEWDMGSPWYRPIRVCHVTNGAEFGWRTGSGKWPAYYPDNVPGIVDIGQGSPTGVISGSTLDFPEYYKDGLFVFDWSFGTMYYISLTPEGASYTATSEEFLSGASLPLTDGIAGDDGAMYFLTGGRRLESGLYRVFYNGEDKAASQSQKDIVLTEEQQLRRKLESYAMGQAADLDLLWSSLGHGDRRIRYAARVSLEYQDPATIEGRLASETDPTTVIQATIALARIGTPMSRDKALGKLISLPFTDLSENLKTDYIRACDLLFIRGEFKPGIKNELANKLSPFYPTQSNQVNRELVQLLAYLEDPTVVDKTMALLDDISNIEKNSPVLAKDVTERSEQYGGTIERMKTNTPPSELMHYVKALSYAPNGWTKDLREQYFTYFSRLFAANGGESYNGFLLKIRENALVNMPTAEHKELLALSGEELIQLNSTDLVNLPHPKGPGKNWTVDEIVELYNAAGNDGDLTNGENMYKAVLCSSCHSLQGSGASIGPDLTQLTNRFSAKDIAEALVFPDKTISDQYEAIEITLNNDKEHWGRLINETQDTLIINENPLNPKQILKLAKSNIKKREVSKRSAMMPALLNRLNENEIKDLFSFLKSQARKSELQ